MKIVAVVNIKKQRNVQSKIAYQIFLGMHRIALQRMLGKVSAVVENIFNLTARR